MPYQKKIMKNNIFFTADWLLLAVPYQTQRMCRSAKVFGQLTLLGLLSFGAVSSVIAQQNEPLPARHRREFADDKPKNCFEYDLALDRITQRTPADKTIIVISRLGDRDSKPNLNKRRLHNIRAYWTQYLTAPNKRDSATIIVAEGEPTKGFGQIEFYVRGELIEILKLIPNGDFPAALCYMLPDEPACAEEKQNLFYPCKDRPQKQKQKQKVAAATKKSPSN